MRPGRRSRSRAVRVLGVAMLVLMSGVGMGVSAADPGHDHPTTTTAPPGTTTTTRPGTTTTTRPGTTTTAPPGTTTTTRPTTTTTAPPGTQPPGLKTSVIKYGPYNIPAAPVQPDGKHGHAHTGNRFQMMAQQPCTNCYITGMRADLKYPDGRAANWSTDAQLHHMVLFNSSWGRSDATCAGSFLGFLGERFFASGDERTVMPTLGMYGYHVGWFDMWTMIYELANEKTVPQDVVIEMTYQWVPDTTPGMKSLDPVWFDVDQCGDSQISIPAGPSSQNWTWTVNRPGKLIGLGGHLHDGGVNIVVKNDSTGKVLCDSRAGYGETPAYIGHHGEAHISSMSVCRGTATQPVDTLRAGQRITMTSHYNASEPATDAMGIVIAYMSAT